MGVLWKASVIRVPTQTNFKHPLCPISNPGWFISLYLKVHLNLNQNLYYEERQFPHILFGENILLQNILSPNSNLECKKSTVQCFILKWGRTGRGIKRTTWSLVEKQMVLSWSTIRTILHTLVVLQVWKDSPRKTLLKKPKISTFEVNSDGMSINL